MRVRHKLQGSKIYTSAWIHMTSWSMTTVMLVEQRTPKRYKTSIVKLTEFIDTKTYLIIRHLLQQNTCRWVSWSSKVQNLQIHRRKVSQDRNNSQVRCMTTQRQVMPDLKNSMTSALTLRNSNSKKIPKERYATKWINNPRRSKLRYPINQPKYKIQLANL